MSLEEISDSEVQQDNNTVTVDTVEGTRSRGETKSRKALSKLGLKKIEGINRVVMRRPRGQLVVISQPEVFKSPASDCYIVFGEARTEETGQNQFLQAQAMQQQMMMEQAQQEQAKLAAAKGSSSSSSDKASAAAADGDDDGDDVDEEGVAADDIDVVMTQANCSRGKAVKALKASKGDLVQAILEAN